MSTRILLTGALGQLGTDLQPLLRQLGEVIAVDRDKCDLCSPEAIRKLVAEADPQIIVNPAAYTAVNEAETHTELAHAINATAAGVLAEEARKRDAMFVHYSTDYVFDGTKPGPYLEEDQPAPLNAYGASKLAGERAVAAAGGRYLILRTSWVYSTHGNNFLLTIRRLAREKDELTIVDDQVGGPTSSLQLAQATFRLIADYGTRTGADFPAGLYHATAAGAVSWCGFAQAIVEALRKQESLRVKRILPTDTASYSSPARRPLNSVLSNQRFLRTFGFQLTDWRAGLAEVACKLPREEEM